VDPRVVEGGLVAASLALDAGLLGLMLLFTRPRRPRAQPATQDLGPEPPAVVSLLVGGWDLSEDAAESTLIDLGARKLLEFRQPANDARQTTIHLTGTAPGDLTPYERRVYKRVSALAVGGVVPLPALTFRDPGEAKNWTKGLRAEVIADARRRGLSRRRFGPAVVATMTLAGLVAAAGIAAAVFHFESRTHGSDPVGAAFGTGFFAFIVLAGWGAQPRGERDTPAGREAAGRWLGVRDWLRGHTAFADLPPSAVAVWDQYLSYGDAVGVTRVASAVIDMGMGDRKRVWSSFGGTWHRVRVRYSRVSSKYGATVGRLVVRGLVSIGIGYLLVRWLGPGISRVGSSGVLDLTSGRTRSIVDGVLDRIPQLGFLFGVVLIGYGGYRLVRVVVDLLTPLTSTGQVLWKQVCASTSGGDNSPAVPSLYHLAIDDGKSDVTRAWAAPPEMAHRCDIGDTVQIKVYRWSRRVLEVTVTEAGHYATSAVSTTSVDTDDDLAAKLLGSPAFAIAAALRGPDVSVQRILTDEEVSQALGLAVAHRGGGTPGPVGTLSFVTADRGKPVMLCQVVEGPLAQLAWRTNSSGQPVPGIADGAFVRGDRGVVRCGEKMVILTLIRAGKGRGNGLAALLAQAAARVPGQRTPPA
jgi:hypothetical protein